MEYIPRALEPYIKKCNESFKVIVLTGPRQVGKTTMLRHLAEDDRGYVTLDGTAERALARQDPELFLQRYKAPVLIDEIQYAPELLPYIKIAVDSNPDSGQFWLTGSQPFQLMRSVSESLAGRAAVIEMLGLSNAEIFRTPSQPYDPSPEYFTERARASHMMDVSETFERILASSLPGIHLLPDDMRNTAYESYIDTYLMRDIRDLSHVADELKFRAFIQACASLTAKPVVYSDLARIADINEKTAKSWLSILESSYLVKVVRPYSNNLLKRLSKQPIMHFTDAGLAAHLAGWDSAKTLERGAMSGQVYETYVFGELYKSFINSGIRPPFHFFKTNDKKEIDLIMERDGALFPIEVKKTAMPSKGDLKNFSTLDKVDASEVSPELATFKRKVGMGSVICSSSDAYPITPSAWAFPSWAI